MRPDRLKSRPLPQGANTAAVYYSLIAGPLDRPVLAQSAAHAGSIQSQGRREVKEVGRSW